MIASVVVGGIETFGWTQPPFLLVTFPAYGLEVSRRVCGTDNDGRSPAFPQRPFPCLLAPPFLDGRALRPPAVQPHETVGEAVRRLEHFRAPLLPAIRHATHGPASPTPPPRGDAWAWARRGGGLSLGGGVRLGMI